MARPTITVLSPTLSGNAVFRTHALVRLLKRRFDVQLIGFDSSAAVFPPLAGDQLVADAIRYHGDNVAAWRMQLPRVAKTVRGDAIFCVKPMLGSFGAGLVLARRLKKPLILDIDDWERGFLSASPFWEARVLGMKWLTKSDSPLFTRILDGFVHKAVATTVSNSFLQGLYGGHWIPHARDAATFANVPGSAPSDKAIVLFCGSPRGHKGLQTLLGAWKRIGRSDAILRLVVPDPRDPLLVQLKPLEIANVEIAGPYAFDQLPLVLSGASIIVVPQDNRPGALGQLPAKLIDAMAAAKPIIASDVCDAARWLSDGAGLTVTPGSEDALAATLHELLNHPEQWVEMGRRAHERFLQFASDDVLESKLNGVVAAVLRGEALPAHPAFSAEYSRSMAGA